MAEIDRNDRRVIFPLSPSIATNDGGDDDDEDDNDKENMTITMKMGQETTSYLRLLVGTLQAKTQPGYSRNWMRMMRCRENRARV